MKMKKILAVLLILLLILILVLIVRTVTYKFGKVPKNADDKELVNTAPSEQSVRRFVGEYESRQSVMKCMKRLISSLSMNL